MGFRYRGPFCKDKYVTRRSTSTGKARGSRILTHGLASQLLIVDLDFIYLVLRSLLRFQYDFLMAPVSPLRACGPIHGIRSRSPHQLYPPIEQRAEVLKGAEGPKRFGGWDLLEGYTYHRG